MSVCKWESVCECVHVHESVCVCMHVHVCPPARCARFGGRPWPAAERRANFGQQDDGTVCVCVCACEFDSVRVRGEHDVQGVRRGLRTRACCESGWAQGAQACMCEGARVSRYPRSGTEEDQAGMAPCNNDRLRAAGVSMQ